MINETYAQTLFNYLYSKINGYDVSMNARAKFTQKSDHFLYGEIPFESWKKIVERAEPKDGAVFFDLGSGTGRVVLQSYLLYNFKKSIGVELVDGLHDKACEILKEFEKVIKPQIAHLLKDRELHFIKENIFNADLREADFILLPHPFKTEEDFLKLEEKFLQELKPKTKIVTLIRCLRNPRFKRVGSGSYKFSWGDSTAYFFEVL